MVIIATTPSAAEHILRSVERKLRRRWNTYGFHRVNSYKGNNGFIIELRCPELWFFWSNRRVTEAELLDMFGYYDDLVDAHM